MTCQTYRDLMMGYLDDELDAAQRAEFEEHIKTCSQCTAELEEFRKLKQVTDSVKLAQPEDELWGRYWSGVYNKLERGIGWIMMSIGGIALLIYLGFKAVEAVIRDPAVEWTLKIMILAFLAGLVILFVSVLRERIFLYKKDRYKDVRR